MNRYVAGLELKNNELRVSAKNKSEARKKFKAKLEKMFAKSLIKIDYVEDSLF